MDLLGFFSGKETRFTPTQKRIVHYITDHPGEALLLSVSDLARRAKVSEASVVRLAQALGFDGYTALQKEFHKNVKDRLSTVARIEQTVTHIRNAEDALVKVFQQDIENLSKTLAGVPVEVFGKVVSEIQNSPRVFVLGLRGAHAPAVLLATYLRFLGKNVNLLTSGHGELWDIVQKFNSKDLVIGIGIRRYTRTTVEVLEFARSRGAKVGVITDAPLSPLVRHAHWSLMVHCDLDSYIESFTAAVSLINAILTAVATLNRRATLRNLRARETLWKQKGIYEQEEG